MTHYLERSADRHKEKYNNVSSVYKAINLFDFCSFKALFLTPKKSSVLTRCNIKNMDQEIEYSYQSSTHDELLLRRLSCLPKRYFHYIVDYIAETAENKKTPVQFISL